jgi:hypothetical protein
MNPSIARDALRRLDSALELDYRDIIQEIEKTQYELAELLAKRARLQREMSCSSELRGQVRAS